MTAYEEQAHYTGPYSFKIGRRSFTNIDETPNFTLDGGDPDDVYTPLRIIKETFPNACALKQKITPTKSALPVFWLGVSGRNKIFRAVQVHHLKFEVTSLTKRYTPLFSFLQSSASASEFSRQYAAARWATDNDPELATALILNTGWTSRFNERMAGNCIYKLIKTPVGIRLLIDAPHTYNDRFFAACSKATALMLTQTANSTAVTFGDLLKEARLTLYSYGGYYMSIMQDYTEYLDSELIKFIYTLKDAFPSTIPPIIPQIEEPEPDTCIPIVFDDNGNAKSHLLRWRDFIFEQVTESQIKHLQGIAADKNLTTLLDRWKNLPDPHGSYLNAELSQYINDRTLAAARKNGYIILTRAEGRKKYWALNPKYERS